jgi:hypothetical protein
MLLSMGRAACISYDLIFLLGRFTNKGPPPHVNSIGFHLQLSPSTGKNLILLTPNSSRSLRICPCSADAQVSGTDENLLAHNWGGDRKNQVLIRESE